MLGQTQKFERISAKQLRNRSRDQRKLLELSDEWVVEEERTHARLQTQLDDQQEQLRSLRAENAALHKQCEHLRQAKHQLESEFDEYAEYDQNTLAEQRQQVERLQQRLRSLEVENQRLRYQRRQLCSLVDRLRKSNGVGTGWKNHFVHSARRGGVQTPSTNRLVNPNGFFSSLASKNGLNRLGLEWIQRSMVSTPLQSGRISPIGSDGWAEELLNDVDEQEFLRRMTIDPFTETEPELNLKSPFSNFYANWTPLHKSSDGESLNDRWNASQFVSSGLDGDLTRSTEWEQLQSSSAEQQLDSGNWSGCFTQPGPRSPPNSPSCDEEDFCSVRDRLSSSDKPRPASLSLSQHQRQILSSSTLDTHSHDRHSPVEFLSLDFESEHQSQSGHSSGQFDQSKSKNAVPFIDHRVSSSLFPFAAAAGHSMTVSSDECVVASDAIKKPDSGELLDLKKLHDQLEQLKVGHADKVLCDEIPVIDHLCESVDDRKLRRLHREYLQLNDYMSNVKNNLAEVDQMLLALCYRYGIEKRILNQYFDFCLFGVNMDEYFRSIRFKIRLLFTRKLQLDVKTMNGLIRKGTLSGKESDHNGSVRQGKVGWMLNELDAMDALISSQHSRILRFGSDF